MINDKYIEIVRYIIVGVVTTLVSFVFYYIFYNFLKLEPNIANIYSIILAIIFAYFTNKLFVFQTKFISIKFIASEFLKFVGSRIVTMITEVVLFYIVFEFIGVSELLTKAFVTVVTVVLNYFFSKFYIFKKYISH